MSDALTNVIDAVSARVERIRPERPWLSYTGAYSDAACELLAEMTADRDRLAAIVAGHPAALNAAYSDGLRDGAGGYDSCGADS